MVKPSDIRLDGKYKTVKTLRIDQKFIPVGSNAVFTRLGRKSVDIRFETGKGVRTIDKMSRKDLSRLVENFES